jgi:phage terminase small subunit
VTKRKIKKFLKILTKNIKSATVMYNGEYMDYTITERQRRHRERLYKAGFKEVRAWVKRKEVKPLKKSNIEGFIKRLKKETVGLNEDELTQLLSLLIKIANGKKEEVKLRKKK